MLTSMGFAVPVAAGAVSSTTGWMQQSFTAEGVKGTFAIPGEAIPRFGFIPVRVSIANNEPKELQWRATFTVQSSSNAGNAEAKWTVPMAIHPGQTSERWIFVPTADAGAFHNNRGYYPSYSGISVALTGSGVPSTPLHFYPGSGVGSRSGRMAPWAVSASLESDVRARIAALKADPPAPGRASSRPRPPGAITPGPLLSGPPNLTAFYMTQSLADWRIWSPFVRIVMRADEYAVLLPANRGALRNWVALGGSLYLAASPAGEVRRELVGAGTIFHLARAIDDVGTNGEGLFTPEGLFTLTPVMPGSGDLTLQKGGLLDQVPGAKRVGDWLAWFFVGFAMMIGPINLYVIAPGRRRHWLFFTLPAISVVAVVALVVAIYLQDGVGGDGARRALVLLVPGENEAAVFQEQVSRTGLLFDAKFSLPDDAVCANLVAEDSNFQPGRPLEYDRQLGQATGDWFRARVRQAQHLRQVVPTRARIELVGRAPDGAPIVESTVAANLRDFHYLDAQHTLWSAEKVAPGTRVTLRREAGEQKQLPPVGDFDQPMGSLSFSGLAKRLAENPQPEGFIALTDGFDLSPIPTLAAVRWKNSAVMVAGVVAATAGKATP